MNHDPTSNTSGCQECGAELRSNAKACWLCLAPQQEKIITAELVPEPPPYVHNAASFSLASLLVIVTLVAVGMGLATTEPGLGILYFVVVIPAWLATVLRTRRKWGKGLDVSWTDRVMTFVLSTFFVAGVLGIVAIAALVGFFLVCLYAVSQSSF